MNAEHLLDRARAVVGHRRGMYGPPETVFERVAMRWSQVLGTTVTPAQVIICLLDLKVARLAHNPTHCDSLVDLIGYSVVLHELVRNASSKGPAAHAELAEFDGSTAVAAAKVAVQSAR